MTAALKQALEALRHSENMLMHYEINRIDGEEIADVALKAIRAAITAAEAELSREQPARVGLTRDMMRAAVMYANGPDIYSRVPAGVTAIEEEIYGAIYTAMCDAAGDHVSDCALHNGPAYPVAPCTCRAHNIPAAQEGK